MRKCYSNPAAEQPLGGAHCHPCNVWKETLYLFQSTAHQPTKRHPKLLLGLDSANHLSTFQKRCGREIFWLHSKCAPTLFVVCLTFAWETARQKFPEIADSGITSQDHIFKCNSGPSKEAKWAATLFSRTTQLSFIGSLNKSQTFIYFFTPKMRRSGKLAHPIAEH